MRHSHDDQMRVARLRMEPPSIAEPVAPPVQLTQPMINRAVVVTPVHLVSPLTVRRFRQSDGAVKRFLATARIVQNLPSFGKGLRS